MSSTVITIFHLHLKMRIFNGIFVLEAPKNSTPQKRFVESAVNRKCLTVLLNHLATES